MSLCATYTKFFEAMTKLPLEMPDSLMEWGLSEALVSQWQNVSERPLDLSTVGRVIEAQYKRYLVATRNGEHWMTARSSLRLQSRFPALGDWVIFKSETIIELLPSRNEVARVAAGESGEVQILASHVDWVFVVCAVDQGINLNKIERLAMAAQQSGAQIAVVITKVDLFSAPSNPDGLITQRNCELQLRERLGDNLELIFSSLYSTSQGIDRIADLLRVTKASDLQPGSAHLTGLLLGSSGAGKSSLVNTLLQTQSQEVGGVRDRDAKGRHTTTVRRAFKLPRGGVLIDSPGLREMKLTSDEEGLAEHSKQALSDQFEDIESYALQCKFTTCGHSSEPGCKVQAAVLEGKLDPNRVKSYTKLKRELEHRSRNSRKKRS